MPKDMDVTVSVTTTPISIYSLLAAIDPLAPRLVTSLEIRGDDAQSDEVFKGSSTVASNNNSNKFSGAGDIFNSNSGFGRNSISLTNQYLIANSGTQSLHIKATVY